MKFTILNLWDRYYKLLVLVVIILLTLFSILYYCKNTDNGFFISISYAALLFLAGQSINSFDKKMQNLLLVKQKQYDNLKSIETIFSEGENTHIDHELSNLIRDRIRFEECGVVKQNGFKYTATFLEQEKVFISSFNSVFDQFLDSIRAYTKEEQISIKGRVVSIDVFIIDIEKACREHFETADNQLHDLIEYIEIFLDGKSSAIRGMHKYRNSLIRKYKRYLRRTRRMINRIEKIYGSLLYINYTSEDKIGNCINKLAEKIDLVQTTINNKRECSYCDDKLNVIIDNQREILNGLDDI